MLTWTIHPTCVLSILESKGVFRADGRFVDQTYRRAYRWMADQMARRGYSDSLRYPVWLWASWGGSKRRRPDLRSSGHLPRGSRGVRLTLDIPEDLVLLSQFDGWIHVLNNWYISSDEKENSRITRQLEDSRIPSRLIQSSWPRIFNLEFGAQSYWGKRDERAIQGCCDRIELRSLREIKHFSAR